MSHRSNPTQHSLTEYIDAHNAYVQQLHATNAMLEAYHCDTVPQLMQELEDIHNDLCSIIADAIQQGSDIIATKVRTTTAINHQFKCQGKAWVGVAPATKEFHHLLFNEYFTNKHCCATCCNAVTFWHIFAYIFICSFVANLWLPHVRLHGI